MMNAKDLVTFFASEFGLQLEQEGLEILADHLNKCVAPETALVSFLEKLDDVLKEEDENVEDAAMVSADAVSQALSRLDNTETQDSSTLFGGQELLVSQDINMEEIIEESRRDNTQDTHREDTRDGLFTAISAVLQDSRRFTWVWDILSFSTEVTTRLPPRPWFDAQSNRWRNAPRKAGINTDATSQSMMYRQRYHLIVERLKRDTRYQWWADGTKEKGKRTVMALEHALGATEQITVIGFLRRCVVLDFQSANETVKWQLEDSGLLIDLDYTKCVFDDAFFLDGALVLATGSVITGSSVGGPILELSRMELPPISTQSSSLVGEVALTGDEMVKRDKVLKDLNKILKCPDSDVAPMARQSWIFMGDVKIEDPTCARKLDEILTVFEKNAADINDPESLQYQSNDVKLVMPVGLVLMGDFSVKLSPSDSGADAIMNQMLPSGPLWTMKRYPQIRDYLTAWKSFFEILKSKPRILKSGCKILFVPGPHDVGLPLMPRPGLVAPVTAFLRDEIQALCPEAQILFPGNPCRIQHLNRRLIAERANLFSLLFDRRRCLSCPEFEGVYPTADEYGQWVSDLMASQSHMYPIASPFPQRLITEMTEFDSFLWLEPLPDLLVISDPSAPVFNVKIAGETNIVNIGSVRTNSSWCLYDSVSGDVEMLC